MFLKKLKHRDLLGIPQTRLETDESDFFFFFFNLWKDRKLYSKFEKASVFWRKSCSKK